MQLTAPSWFRNDPDQIFMIRDHRDGHHYPVHVTNYCPGEIVQVNYLPPYHRSTPKKVSYASLQKATPQLMDEFNQKLVLDGIRIPKVLLQRGGGSGSCVLLEHVLPCKRQKTKKAKGEKKKQQIKPDTIVLEKPADRGITIDDAITLIAMVIANLQKREEFVSNLRKDFTNTSRKLQEQKQEQEQQEQPGENEKAKYENSDDRCFESDSLIKEKEEETLTEEDVYFPGLTMALINKHLANALSGAKIFRINTTDCSTDPNGGDGTTLDHDLDFSTWYLVEGYTNKNFQDDHPNTPRRPTVQSFLKEPGFLDCHPRKSTPKTTTPQCNDKTVMEQRDLLAICWATSSVFTRLGPRGDRWQTKRFGSDFMPYPLSWLYNTIPAAAEASSNPDPWNEKSNLPFGLGKKGTLLTSAHKVWGIRCDDAASETTTLRATHMPDTCNIFSPPDLFVGQNSSLNPDNSPDCKRFAQGLSNDGSNRPRCRRFCEGALYGDIGKRNDTGVPLLWDPRNHGPLDLDVLALDQMNASLPYTTTRISVRCCDDEDFLDSCNYIGRHHASIQQAPCRKGNSDVGKMFGVGKHVHDGRVQDFVKKKSFDKPKSLAMCDQASKVFERLFPHQVIAMRAAELTLGIVPENSMTQSYNQSVDLGNASHFDVMDGSPGISVWTELQKGSAKNWYFVLPNLKVSHNGREYVGVMIKLDHGTAIAWDGRLIRHCTSVTDANGDEASQMKGGENFVFGTFWAAKATVLAYIVSRNSKKTNSISIS